MDTKFFQNDHMVEQLAQQFQCTVVITEQQGVSSEMKAEENDSSSALMEETTLSNIAESLESLITNETLPIMEEEMPTNIEDELRMDVKEDCSGMPSEEFSNNLQQFSKQLRDENLKLKAYNKDANKRIALLTAKIVEKHLSLKDFLIKKEMNLLFNNREIVQRDEIKLKGDLELVHNVTCHESEEEKQITDVLKKNFDLKRNLMKIDEINESNDDNKEIQYLLENISKLQIENCNLRDKNNELIIEVKNLNNKLNKLTTKSKKLVVNSDERRSGKAAKKRKSESPSKIKLFEENSSRLCKLRKYNENSVANGEGIVLNMELNDLQTKPAQVQEEIQNYRKRISELEKQLEVVNEALKNHLSTTTSSPAPFEERCKELEDNLEQMQMAFEDCEDYWEAKLMEERNLFEKERQIYKEEREDNEQKFRELLEKIQEYEEEELTKYRQLYPIDENYLLEQQYIELEAEVKENEENAHKKLEEKWKEIKALNAEIEDLKIQLNEATKFSYNLLPPSK